jgi:hypothetical protein
MARRSRLRLAFLGVFLILGGAAACSSKESRPAAAGDGTAAVPNNAGTTEGGVDASLRDSAVDTGTADSGAACNDVVLTGVLVDRIGFNSSDSPPVGVGGTVVDGTYDLTSYSVYVGAGGVAGPTGISARGSIRISGGKLDEITEFSGSGPTTQVRKSSGYSAASATFATTEICPNVGGGSQRQFTATDPLLTLTDMVTKEAFTFTKR